jgi:hypothetical protein
VKQFYPRAKCFVHPTTVQYSTAMQRSMGSVIEQPISFDMTKVGIPN